MHLICWVSFIFKYKFYKLLILLHFGFLYPSLGWSTHLSAYILFLFVTVSVLLYVFPLSFFHICHTTVTHLSFPHKKIFSLNLHIQHSSCSPPVLLLILHTSSRLSLLLSLPPSLNILCSPSFICCYLGPHLSMLAMYERMRRSYCTCCACAIYEPGFLPSYAAKIMLAHNTKRKILMHEIK